MNRKALSLLIVVVMLLAVVPAAHSVQAAPSGSGTVAYEDTSPTMEKESSGFIPGDVLKKEIEAILKTSGKTVRLIVAPDRDHAMEVYNALKKLGTIDPISKPEYQFIVVEMPVSRVEELQNIPGILHVWKDRTVKLEEPVVPEEGITGDVPVKDFPSMPDMFMSVFTINAYDAWMDYGVYGDNVTVAVLDTGIDVAHPFLQVTLDGRPKIIDIYDASDEGIAQLFNVTAPAGGVITVNKNVTLYMGYYSDMYYGHPSKYKNYTLTSYTVGNITGDAYYIGALPERYFDMNFDGDKDDVYPVLVVENNGTYTAYLDMDMDNDFTDETPMGLFDDTGDYAVFNETLVTVALARVHIGDMDNPENPLYFVSYGDGDGYAMFMWDAHGHGTHVSGTVAGVGLPDDPVFGGVYGVAPNAQLIEVKVLPGEFGFGRTSWIINGMFYAMEKGADVISMSLGGGGEINDGLETPEIFYVNLITDFYGVTFAIAAGNEGPTTNTIHAPGDSDLAITVGNYWESERWELLYGLSGVMNGPAMSSSRGPRDDGLLDPDVMAPGTDIFSSLPMWYTVLYDNPYRYYGFWSGTSMATPHVSGAVALMISYAKQHNLAYNPIMIKRALELSAKPTNQTMIDQGFGLIQVDKAIAKLEELSQEPTTYIFAGTTFTSFKNPIEQPLIPISQAYVDFNGYFQNMFGYPYLYRGVYIRNEYPGSVPIYFAPMTYEPGWGLWYVFENKTYKISTNVDWIILNTTEVTIHGANAMYISDLIGQFSINIDYSKLQKSGTYVGLIYIDDPDTGYIDGYVAVTVDIPANRDGETSAKITDTAKSGEAKHYFFEVPRGTQELRVTLRVPTDDQGNPMGRVKLVIARPMGGVVYDGVPGYYYVGPGGPLEYTWVVENPVEGVWEITAYVSVSSYATTGYEDAHYEIEVSTSSVSPAPEIIYKDVNEPGNVTVHAMFNNEYTTFNASLVGYGVGRLDIAYGEIRNVSQDDWDVIAAFYVDPTTYFIRFGITEPEDPTADLDLYVYYFPTLNDLLNFANYTVYYDQIGPTSDEVFERFMPETGYYLAMVYGYDTVGYNPIHYTFYYQRLNDRGDILVTPSGFEFAEGSSKAISAKVTLNDNGTYLGIIGLKNAETGNTLTYVPLIMQVGQPSMTMIVSDNATLGKLSVLQLKFVDPVTGKAIDSPVEVIINGKKYYTDNGVLKVYYVPTHLQETFEINAISNYYRDIKETVVIKAREPFNKMVQYTSKVTPIVISGFGKVISYETFGNRLRVTVDGPSGYTGYVLVPLPYSSGYVRVTGNGVLNYYFEVGSMATYLIVEVQYESPVTFAVDFVPIKPAISGLNYFYYSRFLRLNQTFTDLYQKAIELGVDNETLRMALNYQHAAEAWYKEGLEYMNPTASASGVLALIRFRRAYVSIQDAIRILEKAIEELQAEG